MFGDFYYSTNEYDIRELKQKKKSDVPSQPYRVFLLYNNKFFYCIIGGSVVE